MGRKHFNWNRFNSHNDLPFCIIFFLECSKRLKSSMDGIKICHETVFVLNCLKLEVLLIIRLISIFWILSESDLRGTYVLYKSSHDFNYLFTVWVNLLENSWLGIVLSICLCRLLLFLGPFKGIHDSFNRGQMLFKHLLSLLYLIVFRSFPGSFCICRMCTTAQTYTIQYI